jgi:hypothetical protein
VYEMFSQLAFEYQIEFLLVIIALMIIVAAFGGRAMNSRQRKRYNEQVQADAIYDCLMQLVESGKQSEYAVTKTLRKLSKVFVMKDFVTRELSDLTKYTDEELEAMESVWRSKVNLMRIMRKRIQPKLPNGQFMSHTELQDHVNSVNNENIKSIKEEIPFDPPYIQKTTFSFGSKPTKVKPK